VARNSPYIDLKGRELPLDELDPEERRLVRRLLKRAQTRPAWDDFDNYWMKTVARFYDRRGYKRSQILRTIAWRIAQDLSGRLAIAGGLARLPDYRDELEDLIETRFPTRRAFCEATGLSEDLLSHVLRRRKHLSIETLTEALGQIGYTLRIAPLPRKPEPSAR
jgi:hypothetical protein